MGKKTKTTKQEGTQATTFDPTVTNTAVQNYNDTKQLGSSLTAFTGPRVADFSAGQLDAQKTLTDIGHSTSPGINDALDTTRSLTQFNAPTVAGTSYNPASAAASQIDRSKVRDVTAGQLKNTDLSAYQDPWTNDVVNTSLADIERQREIQRVQDRQSASGAGAYGGSRHGVADSLTNEAAQRTSASTAANLRSQGFINAQQAAFGDIDRRLSADQGNQGVDYNVAGTNASLAQQVAHRQPGGRQ
jgi:hypothetical protein